MKVNTNYTILNKTFNDNYDSHSNVNKIEKNIPHPFQHFIAHIGPVTIYFCPSDQCSISYSEQTRLKKLLDYHKQYVLILQLVKTLK